MPKFTKSEQRAIQAVLDGYQNEADHEAIDGVGYRMVNAVRKLAAKGIVRITNQDETSKPGQSSGQWGYTSRSFIIRWTKGPNFPV